LYIIVQRPSLSTNHLQGAIKFLRSRKTGEECTKRLPNGSTPRNESSKRVTVGSGSCGEDETEKEEEAERVVL
jgi:hypothetical protein